MSRISAKDHLPSTHVLHILLMLALLIAPHLSRLPLWLSGLILGLGIWRARAAQKAWGMPPGLLKNLMAVGVFAAVWVQFGTLNGHYAGIALLCGMLAMKLTEMTRRRDYLLVIYLSYFVLITHFLFSQDLLMLPLLFAGALAITMVLIEVNHPQAPMAPRVMFKLGSRLILQALPLMLIFFVLFPRIPGPLWGLPSDAGAGMSGLSNSMEPGSISNLGMSDEVAFRARFFDPPPNKSKLYWRGPVFEFFNGRGWLPGSGQSATQTTQITNRSQNVRYEIQLEPHGDKWVLPLDLPNTPLPPNTQLGRDLVLRHSRDIVDKALFQLSSSLSYTASPTLGTHDRRRNLALPLNVNPRTRELAAGWRAQLADDRLIIQEALRYFRQQAFVYTLQPPLLFKTDTIDQFLFETQRGFCEHYASAFTILMRAAGLPARVVTGYQGGDALADYFIIRQSDAHAWSEVWLPNQGWVRVDPTAAVAPDRIEFGLGAALPSSRAVPALARANLNLLNGLRLQWDRANELWNRWILAYGPELQQKFLASLGLPGLREVLLALAFCSMLALILIGLSIARSHAKKTHLDPGLQLWLAFQRKLDKAGVSISPSEGPQDLYQRLCQEKPEWQSALAEITSLYIELRYTHPAGSEEQLKALKQRIAKFPKTL